MVDDLYNKDSKFFSFLYYFLKNPIFSLSGIFIFITLPFIVVSFLLYFISTKFKLAFRISGFYKISDLHFLYENKILNIDIQVKEIRLKFIWFRLRLSVSGVKTYCEFKDTKIFDKKSSRNNCGEINIMQGQQKDQRQLKENIITNPNLIFFDEPNENYLETNKNITDDQCKTTENFINLKEKFHKIIKEKFTKLEKNILGQTVRILKDFNGKPLNSVDNILSGKKSNKFERLIRSLIILLDVEINYTSSFLKFENKNFYHEVCIGKVLIGGVRGVDKKDELDFLAIIYDLNINEYREDKKMKNLKTNLKIKHFQDYSNLRVLNEMIYQKKDGKNSEKDSNSYNYNYNSNYNNLHLLKDDECFFFNLLQTDTIFVNGKLDNGIFYSNQSSGVDVFLSIVNTLTILTEVSKIKVNISILALGNIFSLVESIIKMTKNLDDKQISNQDMNLNIKHGSSNNLANLQNIQNHFPNLNNLRDSNSSFNSEFTFRNLEKEKKLSKNVEKISHINYTHENTDNDLLEFQSSLPCIPIEEFILEKIESALKKMKINIEDIELNILTDNHLFKQLSIKANSFNMFMKNSFNNYFDRNRTKLISTVIEIKFGDLNLFSCLHGAHDELNTKSNTDLKLNNVNLQDKSEYTQQIDQNNKDKLICSTLTENKMTKLTNLPKFSIIINQDIIYDYNLMRAEILSNILSELPEMDLALSCKDLDTILSLVMCIVKGLETIDKAEGINKKKSSIETYTDRQSLRFNYSNLNLCLYNYKFLAEINKFNLDLEISQDKFLKDDIRINFSPIMISFIEINTRIKDNCNKSSYFTSTIFIEGLKIHLEEDKLNSNINIYFPNVDAIIYDDHLTEIISFVSSFLNFILEESQMKKFERLTERNKTKTSGKTQKKEKIKLEFKDIKILKYLDYDDIISAKILK